jgi:hypothetical protein
VGLLGTSTGRLRHLRVDWRLLRSAIVAVIAAVIAAVIVLLVYRPFPSDRTPEGAYMRIARSLSRGEVTSTFAYLETDAQWACFSIRDARKRAVEIVERSYPEPQRSELLAQWREEASAPDGADLFALLARRRGWDARLRRDLSGVARTEIEGERASVVTARGTRYPFRRRDNGIWGLTIFTAELLADKDKTARDLALVEEFAKDFERAAQRGK